MPRKKIEEVIVKFKHVASNEVFEPTDWPEHFFVPRRKHDHSAALRVRKVGNEWRSFDERPRYNEHSFFAPEEPVRIVGNYRL
jgi:hypothetical protein